MNTYEAQEIGLLRECLVSHVISIAISQFQLAHGSLPEVIYLNSNCQMAFIVELIQLNKLSPEAAVIQPVWISGFGKDVPLLYSNQLGEYYLQLINSKLGVCDVL